MRARVEVYFLPETDLEKLITERLRKARKSIHVAMYSFTHPDFTRAIYHRFRKGIDCKVILDKFTANGISEAAELVSYRIPVKINTGWGKMHHKFCVVDLRYILCGSANWSIASDNLNAEDLLFISNKKTADIFEKRFSELWENQSIPYTNV
ncbi:MAG: phospholipase D-like domain-containing protein [Candidatus Jettenia caeni]|nr:MAG: phospholipase D-like domain-containing protein [Candidatus Jettenia caeni]